MIATEVSELNSGCLLRRVYGGENLQHDDSTVEMVVSMKSKEMLLMRLALVPAVKVLKPGIFHCRVELLEQVWRLRWIASSCSPTGAF